MKFSRRAQLGFTLLELMVTITVATVLLGLAVPSLMSTINRSRLAGAANELVASLQTARMEAIRRNARVTLCRSNDQSTCAGGSGRWNGWVVVVLDSNRDGTANDPTMLQSIQLKSTVHLNSTLADGRLSYRSDGFARDADGSDTAFLSTEFDLCIPTTMPAQNIHRIRLSSGGRLVTQPIDANGVCAQ
jgi:type IV fimbrial biogenesis protein FimT